jgi:hypothetical protein
MGQASERGYSVNVPVPVYVCGHPVEILEPARASHATQHIGDSCPDIEVPVG